MNKYDEPFMKMSKEAAKELHCQGVPNVLSAEESIKSLREHNIISKNIGLKMPVTIEDALAYAKKRDSRLNCYQEFEDAYYFYLDDGIVRDGAPGCIILKNTAELMLFPDYFLTGIFDCVEVGELVFF